MGNVTVRNMEHPFWKGFIKARREHFDMRLMRQPILLKSEEPVFKMKAIDVFDDWKLYAVKTFDDSIRKAYVPKWSEYPHFKLKETNTKEWEDYPKKTLNP